MGSLKTGTIRKLNLVLHNPNIIYVTVPKAANTSIKHRLFKLYYDVDLSTSDESSQRVHNNSYGAACDKQFVIDNRDKYISFTFVRNPWDRTVSLYNNKIKSPNGRGSRSIVKKHPELQIGMPFDHFIKQLKKIDVNDMVNTELHLRSQHTWTHDDGVQVPEFIGKVEDIDEQWPNLCRQLGLCDAPLDKKNKSEQTKNSYKDYYNDETKQIIAEIYKTDIEIFNYEF